MTTPTGPSVPNWIARAFIFSPYPSGGGTLTAVASWRPTRTQVVVTDAGGRERRFRLNDLKEMGRHWPCPRLVAPDDPQVLAVQEERATSHALAHLALAIEKQRLQDSGQTLDQAIAKLEAVRMAATEALASLADLS